ncbi:MAG: cobamide remodeling phosphodiesterase CbiR [Promethearchaeota archaeon]
MKFGITPISFDIIDESFDLKNLNYPFLIQRAIDAGYKHIELTMDLEYILPGTISRRVIKKLLKIKEETGITYSVHLPIWSIELSSPNALIRNASINCMIESIKRSEPLDPIAYVIHLTGALSAEISRINLDPNAKESIIGLLNGIASSSIKKILSNTDISPQKIAVENVEFPFDATRKLVDKYNLSICFDTGHLLVGYSGNDTVQEFLEKHMDKIIEFHLNDGKIMANGRPNDHIAVGDGSFPMKVLEIIKERGFEGPAVFELTLAAAEKSLHRIRQHYPDLVEKFECGDDISS